MKHNVTTCTVVMRLSWQIQRRRCTSRSRALYAAWAIVQNDDITVHHLVRKHSHTMYPNRVNPQHLTLFQGLAI